MIGTHRARLLLWWVTAKLAARRTPSRPARKSSSGRLGVGLTLGPAVESGSCTVHPLRARCGWLPAANAWVTRAERHGVAFDANFATFKALQVDQNELDGVTGRPNQERG